jgi:uracil-DNA glycosylase family 4
MRSLFDQQKDDLKRLGFQEIEAQAKGCTLCRLKDSRTQVVFGEGPVPCDLLFIGEAPGEVEDQTGRPFVGPAGKKLDEILASVGIERSQVYISNTVKCRPPNNRLPQKDEMETCRPYLEAQIYHLKPKIIVTLGNAPTQLLLDTQEGITTLRGKFVPWRGGIEVFPMFHPSYLLRNPSKEKGSPKYLTWLDIQAVKARLDELRQRQTS